VKIPKVPKYSNPFHHVARPLHQSHVASSKAPQSQMEHAQCRCRTAMIILVCHTLFACSILLGLHIVIPPKLSWSCGEHCNSVSGLEMITYIENKQKVLGGFVGYDSTQDAIIVSFRGTVSTSITDWIHNLAYTKTQPWSEYPDAKVHHGFNDAWEYVEDDIMSAINNIRATYPTTRVQLTGHSLGAAMAVNAAMDIKLKYGLDTSYLDFGRPRAGNLAFTQALVSEGITGFRVTHHQDIVPHAPPEAFGLPLNDGGVLSGLRF